MRYEQLKPCPFCGGNVDIFLAGNVDYGFYYLISRGIGEYKCTCRAFMESELFYEDESEKEKGRIKKELIEAWNRRDYFEE